MRAMGLGLSARTATAAALLAATGCGGGGDSPEVIDQLTPMAANNDVPLSAIIHGRSFRPRYEFDAVSGNSRVDVTSFSAFLAPSSGQPAATAGPGTGATLSLQNVAWEAADMLAGVLPAGIPAGFYDLFVRDPQGHSLRLPQAFQSLGPDRIPPVVTISSPPNDGVVGATASVAVVVRADDGLGRVVSLQVNVRTDLAQILPYDCSAAAAAQTDCSFSFIAPAASSYPAVVYIDATAIDGGGNVGTAETVLELVPAPLATSLSPTSGSSLGGTSVTVQGASFLAGATDVMFDGVLATVTELSPASLTVLAPPHVAGAANVKVGVGGAWVNVPGDFLYVDPPIVREISPSFGPVTGGTAVEIVGDNFTQSTQILIGQTALLCATVQNPNLILGVTPAGSGQALIGALDVALGASTFGPAIFDYGADGGAGSDGGVGPLPYLADGGCPGSGP
jgi:hypothetical protein